MDNNLIVDGELILYGPVGFHDFWEGAGFTAADVVNALAEMDGDITVRLNSGGGVATEGAAIYNALKRYGGAVSVIIDGVAASAASLIAMAGTTIQMPLGSLMMIHEPAGITLGPADAHRKNAAVLDTLTGVYAQVYATRTGQSEADIRAMMKAETWLSPDEAMAKGFADAVMADDEPAPVADATFDYATYKRAPAELAALSRNRKAERLPMVAVLAAPHNPRKETSMSTPAPAAAPIPAVIDPANPANPAVMSGDAVTVKIYEMAGRAKMSFEDTTKLIKDAAGNLEKATSMIIDAIAARDPDNGIVSPPVATVTADERDRFRQGVEKALLSRAGLQGGEVNEFSAMSLREVARMSLDKAGIKVKTADPMVMVGAALGMRQFVMVGEHTTSDFVEVLANIANKSMLKGYLEAEETFAQWTAKGTLSDFKAAKRVDLNLFPSLAEVPEGGEYTYGTIGDRGESIQLATYGKMFAITRQAIINDDMSVFTRIPSRMGRAAIRTVGNLVYAVLTANAAMSDGKALFHTDHKNIGTGAISMTNVDAGKSKMALQKDPDGIAAGLNIRPAYFLVPVELDGVAKALMASQFAPGTTQDPNIVKGLAEVISDARLSADSALKWYLAANPNATDTIEVAYLNGVSQPTLEQRDGWNVDGVEFKVRLDAGVKALDFRGLYRSTGA
ncbi:ClpP-like prohead protease/major capsid protein fusion protein [Mesorhizobium sp.]|uniref:ClpP-like prohead protease/major capsid protein fusion protein n=1 Tax=Mesorhizobium sp. TaxID=1871066 RepID=UPI0011F656DA|nr:ClpP-like prohead protease/major capsid protein fusion protein [Mesorhizobium sp.]TIN84346.1 MAG: Clp protease ClpP [Mesorhizobium sp.]